MKKSNLFRILNNVKKIFRPLALVTLYPVSFLIPRKKNLWVYGSYGDSFCDNSKYQYLWNSINGQDVIAVWITGSAEIVSFLRSQGFKAYSRWSLLGLWACLRAQVYVFSSYISDINFWTSGGVFSVNLWHGVGLKNIEFAITDGPLKKHYNEVWWNPYRLILPGIFRRPDLFLSTSKFMTDHFSRCFRINSESCFEGGYPRLTLDTDPLLSAYAKRFANYRSIEGKLERFDRWIVYMPTWRDSSRGGVDKALPDYERLSQSLRNTSSVLIIKSHHNETFDAVDFPDNIFLWDNSIDIYPILHKFDVLITDYSSILYDFLALEKRDIILYIYDMEDYLRYSRSLAFPFDENTVGVIAKSFEDLCEILKKPLVRDIDKCSRIMGKFWEHTERGCEDIHWEIVRRISNV